MDQFETITIDKKHHAMLSSCHHATLSTIRHSDGLISTNPVSFVWDGDKVRISTLKNRMKYTNLLANPQVTFCLINLKNITQYVEIRGHATLADDTDRSFFRKQFIQGAGVEPPANIDPPDRERVIITIHPQQVSSPSLYGGLFDRK